MEDVIERLIAAVDASGYKQVRIAADAGMPPSKLSKILKRKQVPSVPDFIGIARAIKIDPARLFTDSELVVDAEKVREAHTASRDVQAAMDRLAEVLASMFPAPRPSRSDITAQPKAPRSRSVTPVRAAANPNAELIAELETERKTIPRTAWNLGARIVARVVGDSMDGGGDPIADGELAFLRPTRNRRNVMNKIALVRLNDGLFLKIFEMSGPRSAS